MIFFVIFFVLIIFCLVFHRLTRSFLNPYKLVFVFGKKGSGKSTLIQKLSNQYRYTEDINYRLISSRNSTD